MTARRLVYDSTYSGLLKGMWHDDLLPLLRRELAGIARVEAKVTHRLPNAQRRAIVQVSWRVDDEERHGFLTERDTQVDARWVDDAAWARFVAVLGRVLDVEVSKSTLTPRVDEATLDALSREDVR